MPITVPTISGHSRRDDVAQIGADEGLPDIGDDRRHDDDGERLRRRHGHREQAHRHRRQAKPDHALDEAGEQEGGGDEKQERVDHRCTLTDRRYRHNLEITEHAFGQAEGTARANLPMRFDLVDLQLFIAVAETRSITNGALRVHLALASASERIKGLEAAFGVTLLKRGRRGVELTPAGESLLDHARIVSTMWRRCAAISPPFPAACKATVRLLANTSGLSEHLPKALAAFLREHPHISSTSRSAKAARSPMRLPAGAADLGFAAEHTLARQYRADSCSARTA